MEGVTKGPERHAIEGGRKGDGTKWAFQTFKEVQDQVEQEWKERSVGSDKLQDRHGWGLDKLFGKEENMSKERKGVMKIDDEGDHHFWKQITYHLVVNEIAVQNVISQFIPYNSNFPKKEEVKEFDANSEKIKARLAKEDKKRVETMDRPNKIRTTDDE
ncbi:hypothetical protein C1646_667839 [Rhizophagus diaphanus]|nr:hypothetical protein C1646_667839 [Rhizophagus diaphanus] [Rhizophagus sp. MUCL 43196]